MTPNHEVTEVYREGNKLVAVLKNEYTHQEEERVIDQLVIEHGTLPADELYFALKPHARNRGQIGLTTPSSRASRRTSTPTRRGSSSSSASAMPWPAAISMRRSMTR